MAAPSDMQKPQLAGEMTIWHGSLHNQTTGTTPQTSDRAAYCAGDMRWHHRQWKKNNDSKSIGNRDIASYRPFI
ncbi:hypothetical protein AOE01nite_06230 [Acetobacter oeni]|uniref:Uncharacterized protein n=1 Tax=Acetobacter oeni TaxID=304077 RepID=A0A511XHJ8_9PROT|nr:hypothetical protein AA21952_2554 [Acetobacter oeni LMG 21952]GEN62399.1 hypothetical protein AOE01nite_06230 [Acetobacter oeni]